MKKGTENKKHDVGRIKSIISLIKNKFIFINK